MATIDHLIVATTLPDEGIAWCECDMGIRPLPGDVDTRYVKHNHLLRLNSFADPKEYLEIIAIDPSAEYFSDTRRRRWFDLDSPLLQNQLYLEGPQLIHWVASVPVVS
jgi:Glyoxalase-like domain